jgi:hypothetical protein
MSNKPKFKPEITRIKLNPEQAVLTCSCFNTGHNWLGTANLAPGLVSATACVIGAKSALQKYACVTNNAEMCPIGETVNTFSATSS